MAAFVSVPGTEPDAAVPPASQLEQLSRLAELGLQASAMVHELRQPLALLKGYAQLLADRPESGTVVTAAPLMVEQCARMDVLLERLRAFARGRTDALLHFCDLSETLGRALELLGHLRCTVDLVVVRHLPANLPAARADPIAVEQILLNLLTNACDAMAERGTITVRAHFDAGLNIVEIEDDGPGIDAEIAARLFEPFTTTKVKGTGLGLWLSRTLAERLGGELSLVHQEHGACFRLSLPATEL